ncbi:hypothetical protein EV363DRAFT_1459907 [Boletus edulis]|nr:hypothetical protein EV363DRAFT_1459907 [Boletus edulis]
MFARLTSVLIAFVVMTGAVATEENLQSSPTRDICKEVCCQKAQIAPTGWQGTKCELASAHHGECRYQFCCLIYDPASHVAAKCTQPKS